MQAGTKMKNFKEMRERVKAIKEKSGKHDMIYMMYDKLEKQLIECEALVSSIINEIFKDESIYTGRIVKFELKNRLGLIK